MIKQIDKSKVHDFWDDASCGENLYLAGLDGEDYDAQAKKRYELEPYIISFADFESSSGKSILEIGVGLGADHQRFAEAGAILTGIDLTQRAVEHTKHRFEIKGLVSKLHVGDAENLDFPDESFDIVYSWGVLHHSPDTPRAIQEVHRVLKTNGIARIMIYHKWSMVGLMLWMRYALFKGRPWLGLSNVYANHLESPGTKAYTITEARSHFSLFREVTINTQLSHADLLTSDAGQQHRGIFLSLAKKIWPVNFIKQWMPNFGLFMLISARK